MRLDQLLVERRLADSREFAQRLIMAGEVRVNGQVALQPSLAVDPGVELALDRGQPYVSRGGEKLAAALEAFHLSLAGWVCADVGASTGGFSDCLLQHGASKIYAIDVGKGILHWKLRQDARVVVMEGQNARWIERLPEPVQLVTIDASFISLKTLLPVVRNWLAQPGELVALVKPQFEAGREEAAREEGVIRDPQVHQRILSDIQAFASQHGYCVRGLVRSPLLGPKGNTEFLLWLAYQEND